MIAFIIRRVLLGVPILIGVNLLVFMLFFYVNTPDQIIRREVAKRATPDQIDKKKRERRLDLPYFYNEGWKRRYDWTLSASQPVNERTFATPGPGHYRLIVEVPDSKKFFQDRKLTVSVDKNGVLDLPEEFSGTGTIELPKDSGRRIFEFDLKPRDEDSKAPELTLNFKLKEPAATHRVVLEYLDELPAAQRVTETLFYQHSLRMLWFEYGKTRDGKSIKAEVLKRIGPSMSITVPSFFVGLLLCIFFSMILAFFRATYVDYWGVFLCVLGMSISMLFYIIGGQWLIGKELHLTPISGYGYGIEALRFIFLPIFISVVAGVGGTVRFYRTIFLEEINKDYVRTARSKGLAERSVLFIHVLKNAMIPILTGVVVSLPFLFMGSLLLESFFAIPGLGSFTLDGIRALDFAIVQSMVMLGSFIYVVALILTDISYTLVDPRVRLE